jgi:hypothetical protein
MPNSNGLTAGSATFQTGDPESYLYVRRGANGDSTIDGDLSVAGDLFVAGESTLPTIVGIDVSLNPVYIKNPYNLSVGEFNEMALIVEGGAQRTDISGQGVGIATYKPFSQLAPPGTVENIGALNFYGEDASGFNVRYGRITAQCLDSRTGALRRGRLDLGVLIGNSQQTLLTIDGSANTVRVANSADLVSIGISNTSTAADISDNVMSNLVRYTVSSVDYPIYPNIVSVKDSGTITKQATATLVPESAFTVPFTGYYSYTVQISLGNVGTVVNGDVFQFYADVSGGSLTPINGTIYTIQMAENATNTANIVGSGLIYQKLNAGEIIQFYHLESGAFTFTSGGFQAAYKYEGNFAV